MPVDNTLKAKLISVVKELRLKHPTTEIAEKTGYSKGNVSEFLNDKNKKEPSRAFLITLCESFGLDFHAKFEAQQPLKAIAAPQTTTVEIITLQRDLIEALKRSEAHAIEAKEAYKKTADILANSIPNLGEKIEGFEETVTGLIMWVSEKVGPSAGLTVVQASEEIEDRRLLVRQHRKGGSQPDSDKKNKQRVKTHQQA